MKKYLSVFVLCALIAFVNSSPLPQDADTAESERSEPNRPIYNAISSAASQANQAFGDFTNSGLAVAKRAAESTGKFIDSTAQSVTNGINSAAHRLSDGINKPFRQINAEQ